MINLIDSDTGISSNSTTDGKFAKGAVVIQKQPTNEQALLGTPVVLSVEPTTSSSILLNYTWMRNGIVLTVEKKSVTKLLQPSQIMSYFEAFWLGLKSPRLMSDK